MWARLLQEESGGPVSARMSASEEIACTDAVNAGVGLTDEVKAGISEHDSCRPTVTVDDVGDNAGDAAVIGVGLNGSCPGVAVPLRAPSDADRRFWGF